MKPEKQDAVLTWCLHVKLYLMNIEICMLKHATYTKYIAKTAVWQLHKGIIIRHSIVTL